MKKKKGFCSLVITLALPPVLSFFLPVGQAWAARGREEALPPLIQGTRLEDDYRAVASLGLASTPLLAEENPRQAFRNVFPSCVRIQASGHYGSGSIFQIGEDEVIIATNRHVLQYWEEDSYITFYNGSRGFARFLGSSQEADVGFLCVPVGSLPYEELLSFRNVRPARGKAMEEGDGFFMVDMATRADEPVKREGEILSPQVYLEDFKGEMLLGKGEALPGMSGSGVFDGRGNYLGMVTGGTVYGEIAAVPAETIREEYKKLVKDT